MNLKIMLDPGARKPERAHAHDAGLDLFTPENVRIFPHDYSVVDLGVHVAIPEGYVGLITSKSGLMSDGITCRGTIDAGYTGSIRAVLYNQNSYDVFLAAGQKVTQLVILPIALPEVEIVECMEKTERGSGGFGSTGR